MKYRSLLALAAAAVVISGCSFENKYEKAADQITQAVVADNFDSVKNQVASNINITRSQLAQYSDELSAQGKLESVKEYTPCEHPGYHCFNVKFQKHMYTEWLILNDQDKVASWHFHIKNGAGAGT